MAAYWANGRNNISERKVKAKHIVQVSAYYPPNLGGQENAVHDLAKQLARANHQVEVLTSTRGGGSRGVSLEKGVFVTRLPSIVFGHAPIMPWFPIALSRMAKRDSIVHLHIGQAFTPEMVWLVSKLCGFKYIAQLHIDFEPSGPVGILLPLYKRLVLKRVLQSSSAVIVLNEKTLQIVRDTYGYSGRLRVMDNGIDEAYFELERRPLGRTPPRTLHLLFVGRLSKQKNLPTLIEAIKLTKRKVHLDIIGEGDEGAQVQTLINKYKLTNVVMHGRLPRDGVMKFYATCNALILPSLYEAQPLVLLEAMAARIPIIGTNVIGVADHIKNGGIVVEPTIQGLIDGIDRYYKEYTLLPEMVERSYRRADNLRWSNNLKRYEALYEEVLDS